MNRARVKLMRIEFVCERGGSPEEMEGLDFTIFRWAMPKLVDDLMMDKVGETQNLEWGIKSV